MSNKSYRARTIYYGVDYNVAKSSDQVRWQQFGWYDVPLISRQGYSSSAEKKKKSKSYIITMMYTGWVTFLYLGIDFCMVRQKFKGYVVHSAARVLSRFNVHQWNSKL